MKKAGFTTTKSEFVDAPVINELPVALECELIKVIDGNMYLGKIVNVAADESVLSEEGKITLSKFNPHQKMDITHLEIVLEMHLRMGRNWIFEHSNFQLSNPKLETNTFNIHTP